MKRKRKNSMIDLYSVITKGKLYVSIGDYMLSLDEAKDFNMTLNQIIRYLESKEQEQRTEL